MQRKAGRFLRCLPQSQSAFHFYLAVHD